MKPQTIIKQERGNALFLILIAVALFAALSYAVTTSGRGSGNIDREQALIAASQVTQFPAAIRTAVTRMVITGTLATAVDFTTTPSASDTADVFGAAGGGVVQQDVPANVGGSAPAWNYLHANHGTDGWYIAGIGTDATTSGRDVIVALSDISNAVCGTINRGLGITGNILNEGTTVTYAAGTNGVNGLASSASTFFAYNADPQPFACVQNNSTHYVYYHAIVEQ